MISRRRFLGSVAAAGLALGLPSSRASAAGTTTRRPRRFIQVFLAGGQDVMYSVDPKTKSDVESKISIPYEANRIREVNGVRAAPYLDSLGDHIGRFAVINGVVTSTVSHEVGTLQTAQMRRRVLSQYDRTFTNRLGSHFQPDAPLHDIRLGRYQIIQDTRPPRGRTLVFDSAGKSYRALLALRDDPPAFEAAQKSLDTRLLAISDAQVRTTLSASAAMLDHLPMLGKPSPPHVDALALQSLNAFDPTEYKHFIGLLPRTLDAFMSQVWLAVELLAKNVAPTVFLELDTVFDSHFYNDFLQATGTEMVSHALGYLFDTLSTTPSPDGGMLIDDVGILVCSELGRFPFLNDRKGKDHYPVISAWLAGPGIRPGMYGVVDPVMAGLPISLKNGHPDGPGTVDVPTVDDLGRTIAEWCGMPADEQAFFHARVLEFVLA